MARRRKPNPEEERFDYAFPREFYETDEDFLAQGYFERHPERISEAHTYLREWHQRGEQPLKGGLKDKRRRAAQIKAIEAARRRLRGDNPRYSRSARRLISSKIRKLAHEGKEAPQRIAIAHDIARRRGFKVPPRPNPYAVKEEGPAEHLRNALSILRYFPYAGTEDEIEEQMGAVAAITARTNLALRQIERRGNPAFLRGGRHGAFFRVRRSNPTLAIMGANPPAGDDIEATWAQIEYRRPDDPDGRKVVRVHEFEDGFIATPLKDGGILLRHPRGLNLWTRR